MLADVLLVQLNYFHPHRFRSRAVIEFGAPITIPESLVQTFAQGGQGKRDAIGSVMDLVYDGLKSVTVRAPDYETLMVSCGVPAVFLRRSGSYLDRRY